MILGFALIAIGVTLVLIALPRKGRQTPKFLRPDPMLVIYPPICMAFIAFGIALLLSSREEL